MTDNKNKMVDYLVFAVSYREIKEIISGTLGDLKQRGDNKDLLIRFIDNSINQLNVISWLQTDINVKLKIRYSKSQLEIFKRHIGEQNEYIQSKNS